MYVVYDDLRLIGEFKKLSEIHRAGLVKCHLRYLQKLISEQDYFNKDNIFIFEKLNRDARVRYLGDCIARRAAISPDIYGLERILSEALSSMLGQPFTL